MDHEQVGLSDDERRAFSELTSRFGDVRVPRAASAVGALRRRRLRLLAVVAVVCFVAVTPLLVVSPVASLVCFAVTCFAVEAGWRGWVDAARTSVASQRASQLAGRLGDRSSGYHSDW